LASDRPVTLAAIIGPHGVTGQVRPKLFGEGGDSPRRFRPLGGATARCAGAGLGSKLGCEAIAPMVVSLAQAQAALASQLWSSQCPRVAAPGLVNDASFEQTGEAGGKTPFDWQFPGNGALLADVVSASSGQHVLRASSTAATLVPLTMQRIVLAPGAYRLTWREAATGPARPSRIAAPLSCQPGATQRPPGLAPRPHPRPPTPPPTPS